MGLLGLDQRLKPLTAQLSWLHCAHSLVTMLNDADAVVAPATLRTFKLLPPAARPMPSVRLNTAGEPVELPHDRVESATEDGRGSLVQTCRGLLGYPLMMLLTRLIP